MEVRLTQKIYIIDGDFAESGHGSILADIIRHYNPHSDIHCLTNIDHCSSETVTKININLHYVLANCTSQDILFTPWNILKSLDSNNLSETDDLFKQISQKCFRVICTAGNRSDTQPELWTPASLTTDCDVIHAMRKTGAVADFATHNSHTLGMYGTNVTCPDGEVRSGSSISAAIYCGIISRNSDQRFLRRVTRLISKKYLRELGL
jgi:hypothetical protein